MNTRKTSIKTLFTNILCGVFLSAALLSCENFLAGADLKQQLERKIDYNNAKDVNVLIACKEEMGTVFPQSTYQAKVGFDFEIQFIPNTAYYVIKDPATIFEAVSRIDKTQSRADCVEFKAVEQSFEDKKAGLYRVNVKILKYADDILIQPNCVEIPYVKLVEPTFDKGYSAVNTPIIIHFNTEVDNSNILNNISLSLAYDNSDMSSYFGQAAFTEDKKTIFIDPKPRELKAYIDDVLQLTYIDVIVSLSDDITVAIDDYNLGLSDIGGKNFTVSYKPYIEEIDPKGYGFFVSSEEINLNNISSSVGKKFTEDALVNFEEEEILRNRTNGTVYIYGNYYDAESGVKYLTVKEQRTNNKRGQDVSDEPVSKRYIINTPGLNSPEVTFKNDGNGTTEFCIAHNIKSDDGAVTITLNVADGCENTDPLEDRSLVVIKDSGIPLEDLELFNDSENITHIAFDLQGVNVWSEYPSSAAYTLSLKRIYNNCLFPLDLQKTQIYLEYSINGQTKRKDFVLESRMKPWYNPMEPDVYYYTQINTMSVDLSDFTVETFAGQSFTIYVVDEFGNKTFKTYTIPKKPVFAYAETKSIYTNYKTYKVYFSQISANDKLCIYDQDGFSQSPDSLQIWDESTDTFYPQFISDGFYGPRGDTFTSLPDNNALPALEGVELEYRLIPDSEFTEVKVKIPSGAWETYSHIYFIYEYGESYWVDFESRKNSAVFLAETFLLYNNTYKIHLFGEKDGKLSEPVHLETEILTGAEFDNIKPVFAYGYYQDRYVNYINSFTDALTPYDSVLVGAGKDDGSGLSHFTVKTDSMVNSYTYSADNYVRTIYQDYSNYDILIIPVWDMDDDRKVNYDGAQEDPDSNQNYFPYTVSNMTITIYDKNNNSNEYNLPLSFYDVYEPVITARAKASDTTESYTINYQKFREHSKIYADYFVLNYDNDSKKYEWESAGSFTSPNQAYISHSDTFTGTKNKIYKVLSFENISPNTYDPKDSIEYGYSEPLYICVGEDLTNGAKSSGKYDYVLPVEGSDDTVLVGSDATTFVHTLVTKKPYSECKDWSIEQWEHHRKHIGDWQLDFSASDHSPQRYSIPVEDEIEDGECYVVVAHFANGKTARSRVFQK